MVVRLGTVMVVFSGLVVPSVGSSSSFLVAYSADNPYNSAASVAVPVADSSCYASQHYSANCCSDEAATGRFSSAALAEAAVVHR